MSERVELDRAGVLTLRGERLPEVRETLREIARGDEAWEALEANGILPTGTVGEAGRTFGGWSVSYDQRKSWHAVGPRPDAQLFSAKMTAGDPMPPTVALAMALGADWQSVIDAEVSARAAWDRLRPWGTWVASESLCVCWRLGHGAREKAPGPLQNARDSIGACASARLWEAQSGYAGNFDPPLPIEEMPELMNSLANAPVRSVGEVNAVEDAWCSKQWDLRREKGARGNPGRDFVDFEYDMRFGAARLFAELRPSASKPLVLDSDNPFEALIAVWNTGFAPVSFGARMIVLEAPPV